MPFAAENDSLTSADFTSYIERHLGSLRCEACANETWALQFDPTGISSGPVFTVPDVANAIELLSTCVVSCKNCGNIKYFLRSHVVGWLKENENG